MTIFRFTLLFLMMISLVMATGCTSIRSSFLDRCPDGKFSTCSTTKAKGVPVKLKVPTHVEVNIEEVFYLNEKGKVLFPQPRLLQVAKPEKIYEYQLFAVDIVRPFSGILNMMGDGQGYVFDENQQLKSLGATVTDNTISTTTAILEGEAGKLFKTSVGGIGGQGLVRRTRVIATRRFSIADPNWHMEMNDWIECYLQNCSVTCPITNDCPSCYQGVSVDAVPVHDPALQFDGAIVDVATED